MAIGYSTTSTIFCQETWTISWFMENTALLGLWARPTHALRLNFDLEHTNYNNVIVRISPRKEVALPLPDHLQPAPMGSPGRIRQHPRRSNGDSLDQYVGHNQNYGLTASLAPRERFGLDLAYNYNRRDPECPDLLQRHAANRGDPSLRDRCQLTCAANETANPLLANSFYTNHTHFGMATVRFKSDKRVTANVGGSITNVDGSVPQFNILQPLGSSQYKYQQPVANLSVDLGHKLAWNSGWNYYQYDEGSFVGPTAPRYFHANTLTESLRYEF